MEDDIADDSGIGASGTSNLIRFGTDQSQTQDYLGELDEIHIYNTALTGAEILSIYSSGSPTQEPLHASSIPYNFADYSGDDNHGLITSGMVSTAGLTQIDSGGTSVMGFGANTMCYKQTGLTTDRYVDTVTFTIAYDGSENNEMGLYDSAGNFLSSTNTVASPASGDTTGTLDTPVAVPSDGILFVCIMKFAGGNETMNGVGSSSTAYFNTSIGGTWTATMDTSADGNNTFRHKISGVSGSILISGGTTTINPSDIDTGYSNELQFTNAGLTITSASYPSGTSAWTVNNIVTPDQSTAWTMLSAGSTAGDILFNVDDSFVSMSINGVDIFNKVLSTPMNVNSATAISITRTTSGVYDLFINGTSQALGVTDTTSLGTITDDKWYMGMKPDLTNSGIWRSDEFSVESQVRANANEFGLRLVQTELATTNSATTTYDDNSVVGGNEYYYSIKAENAVGLSDYVTPFVSGLAGSPPDPPTITGTSIASPNTTPLDITISWSSPLYTGTAGITNYEVYRDATLIDTVGNVNTYTDTVPNGGGTFVYSLKSITSHGTSTLSGTASQTTATPPPAPTSAPTLDIANPNATPLDVTVSFALPSSGGSAITSFEIFRSVDDITYSSVGTTSTLLFSDTVPNAGTFYYKFASTNLVGTGSQSPSSNITTANEPDAITDLAVSAITDTTATLTWSEPNSNGSNIVDYTLYRDGVLISTSATTGFSDTGLITQTSYDYTVYARNNVGLSLISNSVTQVTDGVPGVVSLTATTAAIDQINLTWTEPNNYNSAITSYVIERESPTGGGFTTLITLGSVLSYSDGSLAAVTEYNYRITAVNGYGNGATSTSSAITLPAPPTNVVVTPNSSSSELIVTWTTPTLTTGITGYQIVREDGIGTGFSPITIATGVTFTDTGLTPNIYYNYKLASVTAQGNSAYSDTYSQTSFHLPMGVQSLTAVSGDLIDAGLSWSSPTIPYGYITGYEIYQSTVGTPNILIDTTTGTSYTATDLDPTITYYWLVAPITIHGTNSTGNIANATATSEIIIGELVVSKDVNPIQVPIKFNEIRNGNSTVLTVEYATGTNLSCAFDHKFARTNYTHGSLAETYVSSSKSSHTFTFNDSANEIISVHCYDEDTNPGGNTIVNSQDDGQYQINFAVQPIVTQVNDFQKGAFGIKSGFGAFDLMTLFVVLISMVGFNRKHPAVGVGIMVSFIGAMGYFGIIEPPTIMMGILAVIVVVSIGQARKND